MESLSSTLLFWPVCTIIDPLGLICLTLERYPYASPSSFFDTCATVEYQQLSFEHLSAILKGFQTPETALEGGLRFPGNLF